MQIQNNSQLNFNGRAFNMDRHWLSSKQTKVVEASIEKLNSMKLLKDAECDILIFQNGTNHKMLDIIAQKMSDYGHDNKPLWRRAKTSAADTKSIIKSAKTVIAEYDEKILPLHKSPEEFKPVFDAPVIPIGKAGSERLFISRNSIPCVHAEPLPIQEESNNNSRLQKFKKKIFELFT